MLSRDEGVNCACHTRLRAGGVLSIVCLALIVAAGCVDTETVLASAGDAQATFDGGLGDGCTVNDCSLAGGDASELLEASVDAPSPPDADSDASADSDIDSGSGKPCGGIAGIQCAVGEYCRFAACGAADELGTCHAPPLNCPPPDQCPHVCGCDHTTYCDACAAHAAGVNVSSQGGC